METLEKSHYTNWKKKFLIYLVYVIVREKCLAFQRLNLLLFLFLATLLGKLCQNLPLSALCGKFKCDLSSHDRELDITYNAGNLSTLGLCIET